MTKWIGMTITGIGIGCAVCAVATGVWQWLLVTAVCFVVVRKG